MRIKRGHSCEDGVGQLGVLVTPTPVRRGHADVDSGASRSAGLASARIGCTIGQRRPQATYQQQPFPARLESFELDEGMYIEAVASRVRAHVPYTWPSAASFVDELPTLVHFQDDPFTSSHRSYHFCV